MEQQTLRNYDKRNISSLKDVVEAEQIGPHAWVVITNTGDVSSHPVNYYADTPGIEQDWACGCGDWEYRQPEGGCKHIRAIRIVMGDIDLCATFDVHRMDGDSE